MWLVLCFLMGLVSGELTDEEYSRMPRLFHLDDYESCLSRRGGVYCLGSFHLARAPLDRDDGVYNLMLEYSKNPQHFNRTRVHRGYCVSARCPLESEQSERNVSWRFERCVERWAHSQGFSSTPQVIEYCRTTEQARARKTTELDTPMIIFTAVVWCILFVNVVCTAYDFMTSDNKKKNKLLLAWSMRSNWQRLTAHYEDGDPRLSALSPLQGIRVFIMIMVIFVHCGIFKHMLYTYNTRSLENMMKLPFMILARNGSTLVEVFVMLSSFLLAYNLLLYSKTHQLSFRILPKIWLNRFIRLSPLYLMVVGFSATWWPVLSDGPMWYTVESEAKACRRKFWTHVFYLNNLIDPDDKCVVQSWYLAVDMQLFVVASVATLLLARRRERALPALGALAAAAAVLNGALAYRYGWTTMLHIATAELHRILYRGKPSFAWYYASPWGSLPATFIGLFLAFLHFDLQEKGFKAAEHKWLVRIYHCTIPLIICYIMSGIFFDNHDSSRLFSAVFVALDRPFFCIICAVCIFGLINNIHNFARIYYECPGIRSLGRLNLAALLLHWILELSLQAASPLPLTHTNYGFVYGYVATIVITYVVSVPLTIMVEMPFHRTAAAISA